MKDITSRRLLPEMNLLASNSTSEEMAIGGEGEPSKLTAAHEIEEKLGSIRKRGTSLFSYCAYPDLFYLIFDGSPPFGPLKIDGFRPTLYNDK